MPPGQPGRGWLLPALLLLIVLSWLGQRDAPTAPAEVPYTEFKAMVRGGKVRAVSMRGPRVEAETTTPVPGADPTAPAARVVTRVPAIGDEELLPLLQEHGVVVTALPEEAEGLLSRFLIGLAPWVLFIVVYVWLMRRFSRNLIGGIGRGGDLGGFLKRGTETEGKTPETRFRDVAGQESAKREVAELVEYLRDPQRYRRLGADVPHGVLLMGPPGTGKTLLARALAGESGVPFYSISASEFIEVFVGVGASRVRQLFKKARETAPSILFIDELDSVGRTRGAGLGGGHDEREQTLNQILAELDGFAGHEALIVLAATNRPDVLDAALLRPGRFDRHIVLDLPDRRARRSILDIHVEKVPLADDVDLDNVASGTAGFSGADLKNLVNEAAMRAARKDRDRVNREDFDHMRERVLIGAERSLVIQPDERHRLAVHEAGHTIAAWHMPEADPLYKVSIIPRGRALGGTQQLPEAERHMLPEDYLRDRLAVMLGGRVAEQAVLGSVSSGADDDIQKATALARAMVTRWGMSESIGPVDLRESEEHPFLGRGLAQPRRHSEVSARVVDRAVTELLKDAERRVLDVIHSHPSAFERLVADLEARESLDREEIEACLGVPEDKAADGGSVSMLRRR